MRRLLTPCIKDTLRGMSVCVCVCVSVLGREDRSIIERKCVCVCMHVCVSERWREQEMMRKVGIATRFHVGKRNRKKFSLC